MMTFDDKLRNSVNNFDNITKPDYTRNQLNLYADFVELIAVNCSEDGLTIADVQDRFFGEKDYTTAEQRDIDESFLQSIFLLIEERVYSYTEHYPFIYDGTILKIKADLTSKNKLYLSLLFSSKLNLFKDFKTELTTEFETISFSVLKEFLPQNSILKEFGKNTTYTGNAINKIRQLANDLELDVNEYELGGVGERNQQERGLDLIGWIPFNDSCKNKIIFLAQCACGKDYESKQHDTRRFEQYLEFYKTKPQHTMFIPYSLLNVRAKKFYHSDLIENDFLIFERKRIIELHNEDFDGSASFNIVESFLSYQRPAV